MLNKKLSLLKTSKMKKFDTDSIATMSKIPRLNLINSVTGYKSANLIGTCSKEGTLNVAVFSSITHLGSNPPMLGFMVRPVVSNPRDTYKNITETHYFTVNHITSGMIESAHHTSANYDSGISEFDKTDLKEEFLEEITVPFVKNSPVRLLCKYLNEYKIEENGCIHIIASIEKIFVEEDLIENDLFVRLDKGNVVTVNGVDGYALPNLINRFEYAQPNQISKSKL